MAFYIAQAISVLTALVAVFMVQFKTMEKILVGQIMANVLTASTYFLLGGFSGAGICFIAILQSVIMFLLAKKRKASEAARNSRFCWIISCVFFPVLFLFC